MLQYRWTVNRYAKYKPDFKGQVLIGFHLYETPRVGKSIETRSRLMVSRGEEENKWLLIGEEGFFGEW